jgi:hypothetical protein
MDNNIFSTFNNNHLSDIVIGGSGWGGSDGSNYIIIIAIILLVIIVIYYIFYKKEIFSNNALQTSHTSQSAPHQEFVKLSVEQINNIEQEIKEIRSNLSEIQSNTSMASVPTATIPTTTTSTTIPTTTTIHTTPATIITPIIQPAIGWDVRGRQFDPIAIYDYRKLHDPLVDPRGRTSADEIPTLDVALQLNIPTQGFPDTYHRVGLLMETNEAPRRGKKELKTRNGSSLSIDGTTDISTNTSTNTSNSTNTNNSTYSYDRPNFINHENNILELIGKKMGHDWYRYFTSISIGNKIIKINVHNRNRRELYDDDRVYIPELSKWYRVKIDRMDMIDYSPYVL